MNASPDKKIITLSDSKGISLAYNLFMAAAEYKMNLSGHESNQTALEEEYHKQSLGIISQHLGVKISDEESQEMKDYFNDLANSVEDSLLLRLQVGLDKTRKAEGPVISYVGDHWGGRNEGFKTKDIAVMVVLGPYLLADAATKLVREAVVSFVGILDKALMKCHFPHPKGGRFAVRMPEENVVVAGVVDVLNKRAKAVEQIKASGEQIKFSGRAMQGAEARRSWREKVGKKQPTGLREAISNSFERRPKFLGGKGSGISKT